MKIGIVCFNLNWQSGGPRLIFTLAKSLEKLGHAVIIYTPEFTGKYFQELWKGLDIRVIPPHSGLKWSGRSRNLLAWVGGKIKQERVRRDIARRISAAIDPDIDVLNVHDFAYPVGYFYKKRNSRAKVLWTENDPPYMYLPKEKFVFDLLSRIYNWYKDVASRKYFAAIDAVSVLDSYNRDWCEKRGLRPEIVRLGVDFEKFNLPVKDFSSQAKKKQVTLFGLGSLNSYRRYEDIILAAKDLRDWGYSPVVHIISNDMWNESGYRDKMLRLVREHALDDNIKFNFKGVSEAELMNAYAASDVFVYPMYVPPPRNGFGFSIGVFEAMAAGLPVVLCRTTTSTEVLEDGKTALFVDSMSHRQIAEKIKLLLDHPELYRRIAEAGQRLVAEKLRWDDCAKRMIGIVIRQSDRTVRT